MVPVVAVGRELSGQWSGLKAGRRGDGMGKGAELGRATKPDDFGFRIGDFDSTHDKPADEPLRARYEPGCHVRLPSSVGSVSSARTGAGAAGMSSMKRS